MDFINLSVFGNMNECQAVLSYVFFALKGPFASIEFDGDPACGYQSLKNVVNNNSPIHKIPFHQFTNLQLKNQNSHSFGLKPA